MVGPMLSHVSGVRPSEASTAGGASSSARLRSSSRCAIRVHVSARALVTRGSDMLEQLHHTRAHHPRRGQVLARPTDQQLRRIVLHRPGERKLVEFPPLRPIDGGPAACNTGSPEDDRCGSAPGRRSRPTRRPVTPVGWPAAPPPPPVRLAPRRVRTPAQAAHSCTAEPKTCAAPRNWCANPSSAPVGVTWRINSARVISGNPRSCVSSSSGTTSRVATPAAHRPAVKTGSRTRPGRRWGITLTQSLFSLETTECPTWRLLAPRIALVRATRNGSDHERQGDPAADQCPGHRSDDAEDGAEYFLRPIASLLHHGCRLRTSSAMY